jgi:hypothetical protein
MTNQEIIATLLILNPSQGKASAKQALAEYKSGDVTGLIEKFNLPSSALRASVPLEEILQECLR